MSEFTFGNPANQFKQHSADNRNMDSICGYNNQNGNHQLYFYSGLRAMCWICCGANSNITPGNSNFYSDSNPVCECHSPCTSIKFDQFTHYNRYMESFHHQYCKGRKDYLFFYSGCRAMCQSGNYGNRSRATSYSCLYSNRTTLFKF